MIQQIIAEFIQSRRRLGLTSATINDYIYFLNGFEKWLTTVGITELTVDTFNLYTDFLLSSNIKRVSVRTCLTHLRALYHWAVENELIFVNLSKLKLPKKEVDVIDVLTDAELATLLSVFSDSGFLEIRNKLIVMCMLDCGFRRSDVVNLLTENVRDNYFILDGKGIKQRVVPFGNAVCRQLSAYSSIRPTCDHFFTLKTGEPITVDAIKKLFTMLKAETGINRLKPHLLRHTFATNYLYNGGNLEMLRLILGHTDISTTQIYLHLAETKKLVTQKHISYLDFIK